ncbi:hypothetical protein I6J39_34945 (plasmid) [Streptomyces californicus]|uniref:Uncharacterized protein n=2 Tax=Streptomyces TaxID=1883 RepID=A0ABX7JCR1_9ACTN|nr:hypothetical protein I6J39_00065 [Streptomyces californicus]QRV32537.1 hypothetical protein I6J39_34945 [Streptomyces californicus]QRV45952.1 hypothetical protein I6J41_34870 [Streptomyces californicus]
MSRANTAPIALPDESEVPPGPHRSLLLGLHEIYESAGFPSTRKISEAITRSVFARDVMSHQTVANILSGRRVPRWLKVEALVDALLTLARRATMPEIERFRSLWLSVNSPERASQPFDHRPMAEAPDSESSQHVGEDTSSESARSDPSNADEEPDRENLLIDSSDPEGMGRVRFIASRFPGPDMFELEHLPGMMQVIINTHHPMGDAMAKAILSEGDSDASLALRLLILSWARMEDETPSSGRGKSPREVRKEWGRYGRLFADGEL